MQPQGRQRGPQEVRQPQTGLGEQGKAGGLKLDKGDQGKSGSQGLDMVSWEGMVPQSREGKAGEGRWPWVGEWRTMKGKVP